MNSYKSSKEIFVEVPTYLQYLKIGLVQRPGTAALAVGHLSVTYDIACRNGQRNHILQRTSVKGKLMHAVAVGLTYY